MSKPHWLDNDGYLRVNEHFQVEGEQRVFACGDMAGGLFEEKLAQSAQRHAAIVVQNIKKIGKGQDSLKSYQKAQVTTMLVSVGPKNAMLVTNKQVIMQGSVASKLKDFVEYKTLRDYKEG